MVAIQPGDGAVAAAVDSLEAELRARGISALIDDRDERPGVKFNDADLIGLPLRATIGPRGLGEGKIELKPRAGGEALDAAVAEAADAVAEALAAVAG